MKVCKGGLLHAMQWWSCVLPPSNKQQCCVEAMTEMLLVLTLTVKPKLIAAMIPYFSSYFPPLTLKPNCEVYRKNPKIFETQQFRDESVSLPEKIIEIRIKNTKYFSLVCGAHVPVHFLWILMSKLLLKLLTREFLDPKTEVLVARITPWKTFSNVHLSTSHLNCLSITSRAKFKIGTPTINRRKLK